MGDYGVYVIQLKLGTRLLDHPPLPAIYVGQSWHPADERFRQHQDGDRRGSRKIAGKCRFLCPELYADIPRVADQGHAVKLEEERALRLREAGFTVICNGEWRDRKWPHARLRPYDLDDLQAVEAILRDHAKTLDEDAGRVLQAHELERILTWSSGDPCFTDLVPAPNQLAGRYRHVERAALRAVLEGWFSQA